MMNKKVRYAPDKCKIELWSESNTDLTFITPQILENDYHTHRIHSNTHTNDHRTEQLIYYFNKFSSFWNEVFSNLDK